MNFLTSDDEQASQQDFTEFTSLKLLDSQLTSLQAGLNFEKSGCHNRIIDGKKLIFKTNVAILADITGYGKTLVALALTYLNSAPDKCKRKCTIAKTGIVTVQQDWTEEYLPLTVIVVPNKLIGQWVKEIENTTLTYSIVSEALDFAVDVLLCPASKYNVFWSIYAANLYFYRVIIDEADTICIKSMMTPRAAWIWLVTATPEALPHSRSNGWIKNTFTRKSTLDWDLANVLSIRCDPEFTRSCCPIPPIVKNRLECWTPAHIRTIKDYVPANVQCMLFAGDLVGAVRAMGGGEHSTMSIIDIIKNRFRLKITQCRNQERAAKTIDKKESLKAEISSLKQSQKEFLAKISAQQTCPICYDNIEQLCLTPCCNGFFCHACISEWFQGNSVCPLCRSSVYIGRLIIHNPNVRKVRIKNKTVSAALSKEDTIAKLLQDNPRELFLIFSERDQTFSNLTAKIPSGLRKLTGHSGTIKKILDDSREGKIQAIFMNARKDGAGLNLPWIKNVIIYHKLCGTTLTQVLGRTTRLGQTHSVRVWFLEYEGEYNVEPNTKLFE